MPLGSSIASPASQQPHDAVSSFYSAVPGSPYYIAVGPPVVVVPSDAISEPSPTLMKLPRRIVPS